jgi:uncharacterized protein (TIGR00255 family)
MTAFGRASAKSDMHAVCAEITSVNKRFLEISFRLPRAYQYLEASLRKEISQKIHRGQVFVAIEFQKLCEEAVAHRVDRDFVRGRQAAMQQIAEMLGCTLPPEKLCIELCRQESSFCDVERSSCIEELIVQAVGLACDEVNGQRAKEGEFLEGVLRGKISELQRLRELISIGVSDNVERVKNRLHDLLKRYVPHELVNDDRVLREIVLLVDKADISEELERITHHLHQFELTLKKHEPIGKLLDFLLQELLREFSTLGAKAAHNDVATCVVLAKTEIEKMREQVQNVE